MWCADALRTQIPFEQLQTGDAGCTEGEGTLQFSGVFPAAQVRPTCIKQSYLPSVSSSVSLSQSLTAITLAVLSVDVAPSCVCTRDAPHRLTSIHGVLTNPRLLSSVAPDILRALCRGRVDYARTGRRRNANAVMLIEMHGGPHMLLLQVRCCFHKAFARHHPQIKTCGFGVQWCG